MRKTSYPVWVLKIFVFKRERTHLLETLLCPFSSGNTLLLFQRAQRLDYGHSGYQVITLVVCDKNLLSKRDPSSFFFSRGSLFVGSRDVNQPSHADQIFPVRGEAEEVTKAW